MANEWAKPFKGKPRPPLTRERLLEIAEAHRKASPEPDKPWPVFIIHPRELRVGWGEPEDGFGLSRRTCICTDGRDPICPKHSP